MNDRPTAEELLGAVRRFLADDVVPALDGHLKYQARVAANVCAIVGRELASQDKHLHGEWRRLTALLEEATPRPESRDALETELLAMNEALVQRIRSGGADRGPWRQQLVAHLRQTVADKLEVAKG